jgi:hypothetical protein
MQRVLFQPLKPYQINKPIARPSRESGNLII